MAQKLALCIGINDYPGTGSDLSGCVNDAKDWTAALKARGFACETLLDDEATGDAIRDRLRRLAKQARKGDIVVVTYSGHGSYVFDEDGDEESGVDGTWCPYDVDDNGDLLDDELGKIFRSRAKGVRWVVISDSCHSGTVARLKPSRSATRRARFLAPRVFLDAAKGISNEKALRMRRGGNPPGAKDALLLAGCQEWEYSYDASFDGRANGAFSYTALRALEALAPEATYDEWYARIRQELPTEEYPQEPNLVDPAKMKRWIVLLASGETPSAVAAPAKLAPALPHDLVSESEDIGRELARETIARRGPARDARRGPTTPLIAEGDSWFDFPFRDVLKSLEDHYGFDISTVAHRGDTVEDMAYSGRQLDAFLRELRKMLGRGQAPKAVLLSGGGNDVVGEEFAQLLNHRRSGLAPLDPVLVDQVVNKRMAASYMALIHSITETCGREVGARLPIFIHGYAYAVPDGRSAFRLGWITSLAGPWLRPSFERKGYESLAEMQPVVDTLIDRLNEMQQEIARLPNNAHVHYVDLRRAFPRTGDHTDWWGDELHPTDEGFDAVATLFARDLAAAGID